MHQRRNPVVIERIRVASILELEQEVSLGSPTDLADQIDPVWQDVAEASGSRLGPRQDRGALAVIQSQVKHHVEQKLDGVGLVFGTQAARDGPPQDATHEFPGQGRLACLGQDSPERGERLGPPAGVQVAHPGSE